ncbi:Arc family DNA-binding protein [Aeromonas hydrophila]|uniref:Arc family DNA-binding protein n=1 Tax=Aeromonas hydrophila TaxID=644 RepID=UPI003F792CE8
MKKSTAPTGRASDKFMLRLPDGMRDTISELAKASGRSMNAEIVHRLQRTFEEDVEFADGNGVRYIEGLKILPRESQAIKYMTTRDDVLKKTELLLSEVRDLLKENEGEK